MQSLFFAASTGGFYDAQIHDGMPPDAVQITEQEKADIMASLSAGKLIAADASGKPVAVDHPPLTPAQVAQATQGQIAALEREQLLPRATREFMLDYMAATFTAAQLAQNPGYGKVKAFDAQIAALRKSL